MRREEVVYPSNTWLYKLGILMISDIPTGFCNTDLIFIFLKYIFFFILSYVFLYSSILLQISYT